MNAIEPGVKLVVNLTGTDHTYRWILEHVWAAIRTGCDLPDELDGVIVLTRVNEKTYRLDWA